MACEAIVILACRVGPGGYLSPAAHRRIRRGAEAFAEGVASRIVVSGGRRWQGVSEAEAFATRLVELGVPAQAIDRELCSLSTCENARYTARILHARGQRRVALVTCDWHMPRALASFTLAGLEPLAYPATTPRGRPMHRSRLRERVSWRLDRWMTWGWLPR
ncbi:MAG: YdcF family protein [Polyangiaceae bacterium]|nr:YdcF family protein [Polyangiaceae bacterium]